MISSILLATALAAKPAVPKLLSHACDLGVLQPWSTASCDVLIENDSNQDVVFTQTAYKAPNTLVDNLPITVRAGATAKAHVVFHVQGRLGKLAVGAGLSSPKFPGKALRVSAHGFSYSKLDDAGSRLAFGKIEAGEPASRELSLASADDPALHATGILHCPEFLQCRLDKTGRKLTARVSPDAHWGLQSGSVDVALSATDERKAQFAADADVLGKVRADSNPLSVGMRPAGTDAVIPLQLSSDDGSDFRVGEITLDGLKGRVSTHACESSAAGCRSLQLHVSADQPPGFVNARMHVGLPDFDQVLDVRVTGVLTRPAPEQKPNQNPEHKPETSERSPAPKAEAKERKAKGGKNSGYVPKARTQSMALAPPDPPGDGPVLRWSVANEQPLYGYLIYRADRKDGPWRRINDEIIPVLGHDDAESSYAWRDTSAVKGRTYWYFIKTLANDGTKQRLTEAQKVVAH